jgi:hypothetical protein
MAEDVDLATRVPLYVETTGDATETILTVEGELDMSGIDSFTACAAAVLQNQPRSIVVDARGLSFHGLVWTAVAAACPC